MKTLTSPVSSLWISVLSGTGLLAIVSFFPTKPSEGNFPPSNPNSSFESISLPPTEFKSESIRQESENSNPSKEDAPSYRILQTRPISSESPDNRDIPSGENWGFVNYRSLFPSSNQNKMSSQLHVQDQLQRLRYLSSRRGRLSVDMGFGSESLHPQFSFHSSQNPWERGLANGLPLSSASLSTFSLRYKLTDNVSAILQSGSWDPYLPIQRNGSQVQSLAGFDYSVSGILSTRFLAENSAPFRLQRGQDALQGTGNWNRNNEALLREMGNGLQNYDWETQIKPSKLIRLQTGIAHLTRQSVWNGQSNASLPDAGRVGMSIGTNKLLLDLRYQYYNTTGLGRDTFATVDAYKRGSDYARVGVQFALDPQERFSLFLGNEFHNLATNNARGNERAQVNLAPSNRTSFTATLRGKTGRANSNFFLNMQNNSLNLDPFGVGLGGVGAQARTNPTNLFEAKTSLGMETWF